MTQASPFFTSLKELFAFLELPEPKIRVANSRFSFFVSRHFASKIRKGDPNDPLLREILPTEDENRIVEGFSDDPVGDVMSEKAPGILQKYKARVLVEPTFACSLHCRFCFRRAEARRAPENFPARLSDWLSEHPDISEVILSGGDPLMLSRQNFEALIDGILPHDHVRTLRIHTRIPVTCPQVLSENSKTSLLEPLRKVALEKKLVVITHVDHPRELDDSSRAVLDSLRKLGAHLLNQSALLKGVNDSAEVLGELSQKLFEQGVLPYYLHQLDHATGVAHFEISDEKALQIMEELRNSLPGYLVPKLVREIAGEKSKRPIWENC